jgi:hypothetical protein
MRQSLKISLSLLIALVLFAAFSVLAFRGGFDYLQAAFFQPRVLRERGRALEEAAGAVQRYHEANVKRFREALAERPGAPEIAKPYIASAFAATGQQSREDIFNRGNLFGKLLEEYPNLLGVRFLDRDGERVHFSTFPRDSSYGADRKSVTYLDFSKSEPGLKGPELVVGAGQEPRLFLEAAGGRLLYCLPVSDARGTYRGCAVFFVAVQDLQAALAREGGLATRGLLLVDGSGALVNFPDAPRGELAQEVGAAWRRPNPAENADLELSGGQGPGGGPPRIARYLLLSRPAGRYGLVGWLVPYSAIELQPLLKIILLAAVLLTVFLVVFLVFNIRQDPQVVLARRIKRFQLDVLTELIEGREKLDWKRWSDQLAANRLQLRSRFKQGMGRIPAGKEAEVDGLIDRGWDEIIGIIEARLGEPGREKVAVSQIEEMIQKALDRGRFTVAGTLPAAVPGLPAAVPAPPAEPPPRKPAPRPPKLVVEEIGVEEVSELAEAEPVEEEAVPSAPAASRPGPVPAAAAPAVTALAVEEEAEEAEELEEAEPVAGPGPAAAAPATAAPAAAVEEAAAEPVEEAEELEGAEEVEEAEEVAEEGQAREPAVRQPVVAAPAAAAPVAAASAAEEAEEILEEIVEEVGREPAVAVPVAQAPAIPVLEPAAAAAVPPAAELVAQEGARAEPGLEELESVGEIVALPPEPQEKLEELPQVEEPAPAAARSKAAAARPEEPPEALEVLEAVTEEGAEPVPAAELESVEEEPRALQELLESPAELEMEERAPAVKPADELAQLDRLVEQGIVRAYSLTEFEAQIRELRTSVVMENGVYKVKEEVWRAGGALAAARGRGLMALAEAALSTVEPESGIAALLGSGSGVDLSEELGSSAARGGFPTYADLRRAKRIHFFNGLDYDQYLLQFRVGVSETGGLRSLVEISRKLQAVNAALLIKTGEAYVSRLRIGLLEKPARILFSAGEPFYDRFLSRRQAVLLSDRPQVIPSLAVRFNSEDLKYMQMAIILPAVYQKTEAVLFFGLPVKRPLELGDIIKALDIHI